jgi:autotransporter-associated beta strand protein
MTMIPTASLTFNLTNVTTVGAGLNDYINVTGNLNLNSNAVTFIPLTTTLASGSYRIFDYSGTPQRIPGFCQSYRYSAFIDYSTPNQVNAVVSGSSGSVKWASPLSSVWDLAVSNWVNTVTLASDRFYQLDSVLVEDSGAYTNFLSLNTIFFPSAVTVTSSTRDYIFGGLGRLSGTFNLIKNGSSMLTITNANDFTGPVTVTGGILRVGHATALGTTASGTFVTNSGTLDINGIALNNPGEILTISGAGLNSTGAVINAGVQQISGLRFVFARG